MIVEIGVLTADIAIKVEPNNRINQSCFNFKNMKTFPFVVIGTSTSVISDFSFIIISVDISVGRQAGRQAGRQVGR